MKTKTLVKLGLVLQCCFIFFVLITAPTPAAHLKLGLDQLRASYPSEAPTGKAELTTLGDRFSAAGDGFAYLTLVTLFFAVGSVVFSVLLLIFLRRAEKAFRPPAQIV